MTGIFLFLLFPLPFLLSSLSSLCAQHGERHSVSHPVVSRSGCLLCALLGTQVRHLPLAMPWPLCLGRGALCPPRGGLPGHAGMGSMDRVIFPGLVLN